MLGRRPKRDRRIGPLDAREIVGEQRYGARGDFLGCDVRTPFVKIRFQDSNAENLVRPRGIYPVCAAGRRRDDRRELDLRLFEICCLKTSAADLTSSGVISASVPEPDMLRVGALEIVSTELKSGGL